jgi:DNA-directed RNA polymerase subunit RPC12/RpoP/uncharacterized membrane protein
VAATTETTGQTFPCAQCGAQLHWDATKRAMACPYCGFQQQLPTQPGQVREIPVAEGYQLSQKGLGTPVEAVTCQDCGATVNVPPGERTAKCAFCGSNKVLGKEADQSAIRPESLIPFQIDKGAAGGKFSGWLGELWFRPNDLKKMAKVQEIYGVYVPFWTFDAHIDSQWTAEAGYFYYETEEYTAYEDGEAVSRTRQVQKVRWEPAWGNRSDFYDDTLVCASKGLPTDLVEKFSTFNTKLLTPYNPQFLAGWKAEAYAVDLGGAHNIARAKMVAAQDANCSRDVPGDTQRSLSTTHHFSQETFKHVLLPVWIAAYRYQDKPYRFLVNGQTGEVVGQAPYSFWKIASLVVFVVALISVVVFFLIQAKDQQNQKKKKQKSEDVEPAPKKKKAKKAIDDESGSLDPRDPRKLPWHGQDVHLVWPNAPADGAAHA